MLESRRDVIWGKEYLWKRRVQKRKKTFEHEEFLCCKSECDILYQGGSQGVGGR